MMDIHLKFYIILFNNLTTSNNKTQNKNLYIALSGAIFIYKLLISDTIFFFWCDKSLEDWYTTQTLYDDKIY